MGVLSQGNYNQGGEEGVDKGMESTFLVRSLCRERVHLFWTEQIRVVQYGNNFG